MEFRRKTHLDQSPRNGFRDTGFQFSADFFSADLMPHNPPQRKNRSAESAFFFNLRLQHTVLDPRPYLSAMGGTCDREELARITRGKSRGIGDEQYNHPLPWFGPMLFENPMEKGLI